MSIPDRPAAVVLDEPLLSVKDVQKFLGLSEAGVYRLFRVGDLETVLLGKRRRCVEAATLRAYIAQRRTRRSP
jgi:predicted DNA-binding transcriptional regulator AlpA